MAETVTIYIDGQELEVPKGANLVDAAKLHNIKIPVFCYHPKLDAVGMCRMCLIEMGNVSVNRDTGQPDLDEQGTPVIKWFPKLQTACTQVTAQGLAIRTNTAKVIEGREDILEFLLTSHPLDCPICDKGGECPLQNLTMAYGPGASRFIFDDKIRLDKHVPLGELIFLDRERCIQCARCTRFCDEIAGDPVLAFHERGRRLQIVTISDPPFDTYFSGNTTDICPVGALTTADFRFGARPWELNEVASVCTYCPVGCNFNLSTRMDRDHNGMTIIKRVMPRQNEQVNEIWICDKGRFGHHHTRSNERLSCPMIRNAEGVLVKTDWATAYKQIAEKFKQYADRIGFIAGPSLSNEDYWEMRKLAKTTDSLGVWPPMMSGGAVVEQVGVGIGTRLQDVDSNSVILLIASDLEEEAPVWYLQVKQAADRGAKVIVANARGTSLERYAHTVMRYPYGEAGSSFLNNLLAPVAKKIDKKLQTRIDGLDDLKSSLKKVKPTMPELAEVVGQAENLIAFVGADGLTLDQQSALMKAVGNLLIVGGFAGRPNNGLIPVWPGANMQGAVDMGFSAEATVSLLSSIPTMWVIAGADPVSEDVRAVDAISKAEFVVVCSQFLTPTAEQADIVLPSQSFAEREGTFTNGMRRVQRFYPAQTIIGQSLPTWKIFAHIVAELGGATPRISAGSVMQEITQSLPRYSGMTYPALAHVEDQFPDVGGDDLYYGGTAYSNHGGLGIQWPTLAEDVDARLTVQAETAELAKLNGDLVVIPVQRLYDRGPLFEKSELMHQRIPAPYAELNSQDAANRGIADGDRITISFSGYEIDVTARVNGAASVGTVLLPRRLSNVPTPLAPVIGSVQKIQE